MPEPSISNPSGAPRPLSPGFAGMSSLFAHDSWAEESRRRLTSPGAYEWWYFQALSPAGDGILITLFEGLPFHPNYLSQINRFAKRIPMPFSKPWPELDPSNYPAAYVSVYEKGKPVAQFLNLYPPDSISGQPGVPDVRIGPNRITLRQDGSFGIIVKGYPYTTVRGRPRRQTGQLLTARLTFTPTFPGVQHKRPFRAPDDSGAAHHWVLSAPHGHMTGEVTLVDEKQEEPLVHLDIDALGYHDHVYGEGGLATGVDTLLWGFIQGDTWTAAWHQALTKGKNKQADGLIFLEAGHPPVIIDAPDTRFSKPHLSSWFLKHPGRIVMHGSDTQGHPLELVLSHPSVLETAPFHTRLVANGTVSIPGRGNGASFTGRGTTHVLKLRRLRWPILSDLTLLAITPIPRLDPIWNS